MRARLQELAARAWTLHAQAQLDVDCLVRPSIPILFFGDTTRFFESPIRVVTVGLNPSRSEFPSAEPFCRFPDASTLRAGDADAYLVCLDGYFHNDPYRSWFDGSFEPFLDGIGASYYYGAASVALHTDLCSPLATDPTWSGLDGATRASLATFGRPLWHELIEVFQPDIVITSLARRHLQDIQFPIIEPADVAYVVDGPNRKQPYNIEVSRRRLASDKTPMFVFGRASQKPFASISYADRALAGARIRELWHG